MEITDEDRAVVEDAANALCPEGAFIGDAVIVYVTEDPEEHSPRYSAIPNHPMAYHVMRGLLETALEGLMESSFGVDGE